MHGLTRPSTEQEKSLGHTMKRPPARQAKQGKTIHLKKRDADSNCIINMHGFATQYVWVVDRVREANFVPIDPNIPRVVEGTHSRQVPLQLLQHGWTPAGSRAERWITNLDRVE